MIRLISAEELAKILGLSKRQVFRLDGQHNIPKPLRIGGSLRWNLLEIHQWIEGGCPKRLEWESTKKSFVAS